MFFYVENVTALFMRKIFMDLLKLNHELIIVMLYRISLGGSLLTALIKP